MSNFLLNLARRGAGLGSQIMMRPPATPSFPQDLGARQFLSPGFEMIPNRDESVDGAVSGTTEGAPRIPQEALTDMPSLDPRPIDVTVQDSSSDQPSKPSRATKITNDVDGLRTELPKSSIPTKSNEERSSLVKPRIIFVPEEPTEQVIKTKAPHPSRTPLATQPHLDPSETELPIAPLPEHVREVEVVASEEVSNELSEHESPASVVDESAQKPVPLVIRQEMPVGRDLTSRSVTAVDEGDPEREDPETYVSGAEHIAQVRPVTPTKPIVSMIPQVTLTPSLSQTGKSTTGRSESRPVEIRIGTIEVRATPQPPPVARQAPVTQGFDDYWAVRTYARRDLE